MFLKDSNAGVQHGYLQLYKHVAQKMLSSEKIDISEDQRKR